MRDVKLREREIMIGVGLMCSKVLSRKRVLKIDRRDFFPLFVYISQNLVERAPKCTSVVRFSRLVIDKYIIKKNKKIDIHNVIYRRYVYNSYLFVICNLSESILKFQKLIFFGIKQFIMHTVYGA